jgi:hypothetical protein
MKVQLTLLNTIFQVVLIIEAYRKNAYLQTNLGCIYYIHIDPTLHETVNTVNQTFPIKPTPTFLPILAKPRFDHDIDAFFSDSLPA